MSKRILVVEDQPDDRQIIRDLLASTDYEITEAEDGEHALAAVAKERPDLILMGIQLPSMDGYEAMRRIRSDPALEGALFGLLALMIGFTFAMALTRFEARRDAVLNEANAIARTALRARLLPAPYSTEALKSLQEYAQLRVTIAQHTPTLKELNEDIARSNELQEQLWQQAMNGAPKANPSVPAWLVFDALNGLFDSQRRRLALVANQVPNEVLLVLYAIAAVAIAFAGYAQGLRTRPSRLTVYVMAVVVCAVIILIEDLETPDTGFISVNQQPLIDAAARIAGTR